jgi:hypothetical protein
VRRSGAAPGLRPDEARLDPFDYSQLASLADVLHAPVDAGPDHFLDFDADPSPVASKASELRVSA